MTFKSLFFGFCVMGLAWTAQANFYQVDNVKAEATSNSAKQAKIQAMEQAQVQAFGRLMNRLLGKENQFQDNLPETATIISLVRDMSIQNEKNTANAYWATVNVGFNAKAVQNFLAQKEIHFLTKEPKKLLVIPVYQKADQILGTLEEENPVLQFLRGQENLSDFYSLILPNGDLDEIVLANKSLANHQVSDLNALLGRYGAEGVMLVKAEEVGVDHWRLTGEIYGENKLQQTQEAFDWYQGYSLSEAWQVLLGALEQEWRTQQKAPDVQLYYARLTEPTLQTWVQDKEKLSKLKFIKNLMVQGVSHNQMLISYTYEGNPSELEENWFRAGWQWTADFVGPSGSLTRKEVSYE